MQYKSRRLARSISRANQRRLGIRRINKQFRQDWRRYLSMKDRKEADEC